MFLMGMYLFTSTARCVRLERSVWIQILSGLGKDIFVKEWSTTGYSQGDYVKGIAFCTKERYTKMVSNNTSDWKTQIDKLIDDEVKISNVEEVKHEIDLRFHEFVEKTGKEPEYVECQIVWKKTGDDKRATIKLSLSINDDDNDDVFYYCNGIESFKQLAEYGMGEFIVTFCWSFF